MDFLSYNGLALNILQTNSIQREPILDPSDSTYLYTRWRGDFICTYSPGAINYQANANPPVANGQGPNGTLPAVTDASIRAWLERPRGLLIIKSLGNVVLQSPATVNGRQETCDATTGPILRVESIDEVQGERTWKIRLLFETCIRESPTGTLPTAANGLIVSNRWSVTYDTNWQALTTRTYRGICTVRGDLLRDPNILAAPNTGLIDSLRNVFAAFSVPQNFQRTAVNVVVTPDGNNAHYVVTDTEQLWNKVGLVSSNVPRVEAADANWIWYGSWGRAAVQAGNGVLGNMLGIVPGPWNGWGWFTLGRSLLSNGMPAISAQLPKRYKQSIVRVWGNRNVPRTSLTLLALSIAMGRLGQTALFDTTASEILVTGDTSNYVTVQWTIHWDYQLQIAGFPLGLSGIQLGPNAGPGDNTWAGSMVQSTDMTLTQNGAAGPVMLTQNAGNNPPFFDAGTANPNSGGTRGTFLQAAITQVLESFNTSPAAVP